MAETVKIEIPIEAVDRTSAGVQSATRNLTAFEQSMDRSLRRLTQLENRTHRITLDVDDNATDRMADVEDQAERLDTMDADVEVSANNSAGNTLSNVADQAETLDGTASDVDVGANDTATGILGDVEDRADTVDGTSADVDVGANDGATQVIRAAEDAVEEFDGQSGSADIGVSDNATPVVTAAGDEVEAFGGASGSATIGAEDNASPVIDSARDKAAAWDGSVWTATVKVVDAATAPISAIMNAASNPLTQAGAMLGVTVGLNDTINTYKSFESMMSQVQAISGATGTDLELLTNKAKEMGATTKFTATESAEAMNFMAMAGWKTSDMVNGISGIMNLAAASGESLGSTSDIVTDALTAFGLKASDSTHFADVLAQASSNANTNVSMLGESFKYVAPVAGAMNYSVEDTSLALGLMANASVKGSMAGTALKTALANMAAPTDSMATAMERYGISLTDSEGNMKDLHDVLGNLRSSLGGLSETEQTAAASTIFGKEAMAGMLAIINASEDDYNKLSDAIYNADGAAKSMSETMLDNLEGSLTLMQSAVDGVKTSFGERLAPYLSGFADMITAAMPGAEQALSGFMDFVDGKAIGLKRTIDTMTSSESWKNADLFGKVNIAWDKIVAEPFTKWAGTKGKNLLSKGLGSLFSEAAKILPGGEEAGLTSWLSAGLIAKGATSAISGVQSLLTTLAPVGGAIKNIGLAAQTAPSVGAFIGDLGAMVPTAAKFGIAAAAVTAAVVAIGVAIDNYNQKQMNNSLEEHFGNIELTAKQAEEASKGILNAKYLVNIELAANAISGADEMREKAQDALDDNAALTWKSSVGIVLTADERETYTDNISTFVDSKISELEQRTFAAHIQVETFLGNSDAGGTLAASIEEWARADTIELTALSNDLQTAVETALQDGIISVDEAQAVAALQDKMNSITSRWKQAEAEAQMDWITSEYGALSGKELTSESFTSVVEALAGQRQTGYEQVETQAKDFYSTLNAAKSAGKLTDDQVDNYKNIAAQAIRNQRATDLMTSIDFENNTLQGTYGETISSNQARTKESMANEVGYLKNYSQNGDVTSMMDHLNMFGADYAQQGGGWSWFQGADQNALDDRWKVMQPDASAMTSLVDEYVNVGQAIPKQIMDKFNETMAIGAASGDTDAAWQTYAKSITDSGDQSLIDAINQMDQNGQLGEEFSKAWKRATAEITDEPVTLEGLQAELGDIDINDEEARSKLSDKVQEVLSNIETGGNQIQVNGSDIEVTLGEVAVNEGDALEKVAAAVGMTVDQIKEYNGLASDAEVNVGMQIKIPMDQINVDTSDLNAAVDQTVQEASSVEPAEVDTNANVTVQAASTDTSPVEAATQEALNGEESTSSTTMTTDVTVEAASVDTSGAKAASDESVDAAFSETHETTGSANVTLDQTNNSAAVYSAVGSDLQGAMSAGYSVSTNASIHVNYSIANPTASISFGGGGTGSATVSASLHAAGGEVGQNGPELSWLGEEGLEYVIPTVPGRRGRGIALWQQAGQALGVLDGSGNIAAHANGGIVGPGGEETACSAIIPLTTENDTEGSVWSVTGERKDSGDSDTEKGTVSVNAAPQTQQASGNNIEIKVDMNPVIKIEGDGMDENKIFEIMMSRCRELADDLSDEIAERMSKVFDNMPLVQEA